MWIQAHISACSLVVLWTALHTRAGSEGLPTENFRLLQFQVYKMEPRKASLFQSAWPSCVARCRVTSHQGTIHYICNKCETSRVLPRIDAHTVSPTPSPQSVGLNFGADITRSLAVNTPTKSDDVATAAIKLNKMSVIVATIML